MTQNEAASASRTRDDACLFDQGIGYEHCPECWVLKGWLIKLFIDDGFPEATMECPRCKFSYSFDVTAL